MYSITQRPLYAALAVVFTFGSAALAGDGELKKTIQRVADADYAGDRQKLERLYNQLAAFQKDSAVASRVHYWRGFAKWRRAMNGANETPTPNDLAADAALCVEQMNRSGKLDPSFVDARIGELACLGLGFFFDRQQAGNPERAARFRELLTDLKASASNNPRFVWVWGMTYLGQPAELGGGAENVTAAYLKALQRVKAEAGNGRSALDPWWGEPELNVNLAYTHLNKPNPDLRAAKAHVDEAVRLVPRWHYARNILRPQIERALRDGGAP